MLLIEGIYNSKNILLLEIGRSDDVLFALDTSTLDIKDKELIKSNTLALNDLTSKERYTWLKENCTSLKGAYKTYKLEKMKINKTYNL